MTSAAQRKAVKKYKEKVKRQTVDFYQSEMELYEHLINQQKKQTYIKNLIKQDLETKKG